MMIIRVVKQAGDRFGSLPPSPHKAEERDEVLRFMLPYLDQDRRHRVLTMPSNNWEFESALAAQRRCELICVEHDTWRISQGRVRVPFATGERKHELLRGFDVHRGFMPDGDTAWSIFHADLASIISLKRKDKEAGKGVKHSRRRWLQLFKLWSAAWFDFTGPISDEMLMSFCRVWSHFNRLCPTAPLVISYGIGRERGAMSHLIKSTERSALVVDALNSPDISTRKFEILRTWRHRGAGRGHRETIFIHVENK